jgi:hypothetical protein
MGRSQPSTRRARHGNSGSCDSAQACAEAGLLQVHHQRHVLRQLRRLDEAGWRDRFGNSGDRRVYRDSETTVRRFWWSEPGRLCGMRQRKVFSTEAGRRATEVTGAGAHAALWAASGPQRVGCSRGTE